MPNNLNKLLLFFISAPNNVHKKGWRVGNFQETVNLIKRRIWQSISPRWDIYHHQVMNIIFCNPIKTSATKITCTKTTNLLQKCTDLGFTYFHALINAFQYFCVYVLLSFTEFVQYFCWGKVHIRQNPPENLIYLLFLNSTKWISLQQRSVKFWT